MYRYIEKAPDLLCVISKIVYRLTPKLSVIFLNDSPLSTTLHISMADILNIKITQKQNVTY
ncbi:hypothetical protein T4D_4141 [Trichinella pseudospiralis]|uniref:Uncharacterized protein n=1 Tax=Trichinella pseudospiralis TaxID=6337 RepID=A0A0V1FNJ4_TRIPS|nr:hypothetical protein T4D_4141 [Trichinella pseudospiralis]